MANAMVPTKANLIAVKKSLALSRVGYDLLSRKRNILIREMMLLIDHANEIQSVIDDTYTSAYASLQTANIMLGVCKELAHMVPVDENLSVSYRSVMGVEIPMVKLKHAEIYDSIPYGMDDTHSSLDIAYNQFLKVKKLTTELAEVENSVYRLADAIKRTQKRTNALKNIIIPRFVVTVKSITESLEEKEREEFSRMKMIKLQKEKRKEKGAM